MSTDSLWAPHQESSTVQPSGISGRLPHIVLGEQK